MTESQRKRQELVAEALRLLDLANMLPVEPAPSEPDGYSAEAIEVLRGLRPTRPGDRVALPVAALTDEEAARIQAATPDTAGYNLADIPDEPERDEWHVHRAALRAREDALDAQPRDLDAPASRSTAADEAAIEAEAVAAQREDLKARFAETQRAIASEMRTTLREGASDAEIDAEAERWLAPLYPVGDGPGSGQIVEVTVRVMVGTVRSTVVVRRGGEESVLLSEVREHGNEAYGIGEAVEAALREGLQSLT